MPKGETTELIIRVQPNGEIRDSHGILLKARAKDIDLVRCGECDKGEETISGKIRCKLDSLGLVWEKTDFCSYGERRADEGVFSRG